MNKNKYIGIFIVVSVVILLLLGIFVPNGILQEPLVTPLEYLSGKPYIELGSIILIVPSSTFFVYALGIIIVLLGVSFLKQKGEVSFWWGISMILWGLGALLAGTSYQGLGYELKCAGETYCTFTSWFELAYLYTTAISIAVLAVGFVKAVLPIEKQWLFYGR